MWGGERDGGGRNVTVLGRVEEDPTAERGILNGGERPVIKPIGPGAATTTHPTIGARHWYARASDGQTVELLFTENETNFQRIDGARNSSPFVKDGIHAAIVGGERQAVNDQGGSKMAGHAQAVVDARGTFAVDIRFSPEPLADPFGDFVAVFASRNAEADAFYDEIHPRTATEDERRIQRQAFAGLMWSKQNYIFDVDKWLDGDKGMSPPPPARLASRNRHWRHLNSMRVLSMLITA